MRSWLHDDRFCLFYLLLYILIIILANYLALYDFVLKFASLLLNCILFVSQKKKIVYYFICGQMVRLECQLLFTSNLLSDSIWHFDFSPSLSIATKTSKHTLFNLCYIFLILKSSKLNHIRVQTRNLQVKKNLCWKIMLV